MAAGEDSRRSGKGRRSWSLADPGNRAARAQLLDALLSATEPELRSSQPILDSGCGTGWLLGALAERGVEPTRLHGVDLSPSRVDAARARVPGAEIVAADARRLPYPPETFAAAFYVVSLSSMGPAGDVRAAIAEGLRVLVPGGVLVCYEPRYPNPANRSTRLLTSRDLAAAGADPVTRRSLTLLPPLARRLGARATACYEPLARIGPLRSHWLWVHRKSALSAPPSGTAGPGTGSRPDPGNARP